MDGAYRQPASALITDLIENPKHYSFFRAVDILLRHSEEFVEEGALQKQTTQNLMFRVDPSLGFPSSDLTKIETMGQGTDRERTALTVTFLGLHGPSSPLPSHMVETAAWSAGEEGVQQAFNDFFSNRLIWLFYLAWRKYRYFARFQPGANDQFSNWMLSLIGIGSPELRSQADIPWAKMLTYLGVVAARTRSAQTISGVISHAFSIPDVSIREMELRIVDIPKDQQVRLGHRNTTLGQNMSIGSTLQDRMGKFTIVLNGLSFRRFRDFLPSGVEYPRLKELVEFLLKDQFAYDIELNTKPEEVPEFKLGTEDYSDLGWTTFLGAAPKGGAAPKPIVLQGRA